MGRPLRASPYAAPFIQIQKEFNKPPKLYTYPQTRVLRTASSPGSNLIRHGGSEFGRRQHACPMAPLRARRRRCGSLEQFAKPARALRRCGQGPGHVHGQCTTPQFDPDVIDRRWGRASDSHRDERRHLRCRDAGLVAITLSAPLVNEVGVQPMGQCNLRHRCPRRSALAQYLRLQLIAVTSPTAALGGFHGVHLNPWWTPSSLLPATFSRWVRRTLTDNRPPTFLDVCAFHDVLLAGCGNTPLQSESSSSSKTHFSHGAVSSAFGSRFAQI